MSRLQYYGLILAGLLLLSGVVVPAMAATQWTFSTPGIHYWVCPADVYRIWGTFVGGGGSGYGTTQRATFPYDLMAGYGGHHGNYTNVSGIVVIPGTNYTITVGDGGTGSQTGGDAGGNTVAFGYIASGGATGTRIETTQAPHAGGDGETGYINSTKYAGDGGSVTGYAGGAGGNGFGAAGGGVAALGTSEWADANADGGGDGAGGFVRIMVQNVSPGNTPDFSASDTTPTAGQTVTFTDLSVVNDHTNLTYEWDFGDGYTSSTQGNVVHVYGWNGAFTVNLTLRSDTGSPVESKNEYIVVSSDNTESGLTAVSPKFVDIYVRTFWGTPIEGAEVTVTPLSTSAGSFDWLLKMLGIPTGDFNPNSTVMYQTTDIQGRTQFFVLPTAKYDFNISAPGYTFQDGALVPSDPYYVFHADLITTDIWEHGYNELDVIRFFVNGTEINTTHGRFYTAYNDSLGQTTSVTIYFNQTHTVGNVTTEWEVASYTHGSGNFTYTLDLPGTRDHSYIVRMRSTGTTFDTVSRDYGVSFPPGPVSLGMPEDWLLYVGMFLMIFISLCFTKAGGSPGHAVIVTMFFAWIFYFMRWWRDLAPWYITFAALSFFTAVAIMFNVMIRSKKTYRF